MPEHIPTSAEKKCPVCGSATVYEVPAGGGTFIGARLVELSTSGRASSAGISSGSSRRLTTGTRRTSTSSPDKAPWAV